MNMNYSGHAELRDPDWYDPSRSLDRTKTSPSAATVETETSIMHNSLTSLNLDSLTIAAEFSDPIYNHYSIRSLPVQFSNTNTTTIATAPDAPWNESPRSLRGVMGVSSNTMLRSTRSMKPPPGVSALDHLQNSLSSLAAGAAAAASSMISSHGGLPDDIVTLSDDSEYESLAGEQDESLHGSIASLRLADVMNEVNDNEMDATAHAANGHRSNRSTAVRSIHSYQHQQCPLSPQRSLQSSARSSLRANVRYYHGSNAVNESPSFSTLGENTEYYNDGCDLGDYGNDDNNTEIIKVLRTQVDALKQELLNQQEQNQRLKQQYEYKNQMSQFLPMDSIVHHGSSSLYSFGQDSFVSNQSNKSNPTSKGEDAAKSLLTSQQQKQLLDAEVGIFNSIAALKASFRKQQERENCVSIPSADQPISPECDGPNESDEASTFLLDELVLCELEANIKTVQRLTKLQLEGLKAKEPSINPS
jgi:hypothetical protein